MQKDIKEFSVVELKALVYDLNNEIYQKKQGVDAINQEIARRLQPSTVASPVEGKEVTSEVTATE